MTLAFLSNVKDSVYIMSKMPLLSCFEPFCSEKGQGRARRVAVATAAVAAGVAVNACQSACAYIQ